jgi:hypothetical protein
MAGFSGGAALGPAVGGVLIDTIGKRHYLSYSSLMLLLVRAVVDESALSSHSAE